MMAKLRRVYNGPSKSRMQMLMRVAFVWHHDVELASSNQPHGGMVLIDKRHSSRLHRLAISM
jgi:hypothetical protein